MSLTDSTQHPTTAPRIGLLAELQRRSVFRIAGLYLVGAWLAVQVAETLLPVFGTPEWVLKSLVLLLAMGFVPALVLSWLFELTPGGLRREREVDRSGGTAGATARRLDIVVIVLLLGIGGLMLWGPKGSTVTAPPALQPAAAAPAANAADAVPDKSIAVLPFADFSPAADQAWFADGLTEEILNALARTPDLQVSARTSSFRYKGSTLAIPEIAAELRVAHVLEGSVRSTPQRIRVTAQLIRAADGYHLWSQNYDRDPADMIEIQEDLARQIAIAMQTSMDPQALADMAAVGTRSVEAYQRYIRGVAMQIGVAAEDFAQAYALFEEARSLDPGFAAAHHRAAVYWLQQLNPATTLSGLSDCTTVDCGLAFSERIDLAIRHATSEIDRSAYRADKAVRELRWREAMELLDVVLAARPNDSAAQQQMLGVARRTNDEVRLRRTLDLIWEQAQTRPEPAFNHANSAHHAGDVQRAADEALLLAQRWPEHAGILYQAHRALLWDGRVEDARRVLARWETVKGNDFWAVLPPARQACAEGRRADVERALADLPEDDRSLRRWHLLMLLGRHDEAAELVRPLELAGNTEALSGYLTFAHFDPRPYPSLMAVLARENVQRPPPVPLPFACPPPTSAP
jgi:TolB-like protein